MVKACPSCGAMTAPEARFCRLCGAPLRNSGADAGPVSPLAQTVPLSGEGRPTDGFTPGDPKRSVDTSRVRREEIEQLLRHPSAESRNDAGESGPVIIPVASGFVAPTTSQLKPELVAESLTVQPKEARRRRWVLPTVIGLSILALASVALVAVFITRRNSASPNSESANTAANRNAEQQVSVAAQLSEAEALLASGETSGALSRLRSIVEQEPSNARAHRLLGEALERNGTRREAIAEYSAATRLDEKDAVAWHALASAQFAEQLYADAVESYRRLIALKGDEGLDDNAQLEYADALRLAGYTEDARSVYQKVAANAPEDLARQATKHLSELTPARPAVVASLNTEPAHAAEPSARETHAETTTATAATARNGSAEAPAQETAVAPATPSPQPTPQATVAAPVKNSVAQTDPDAYYFQALSVVNGRDPKSLPRPELLRALQLFQNAASAKGGAHREQAQKYAERLGREFDRRPRQK